jgi:hypothetical protein
MSHRFQAEMDEVRARRHGAATLAPEAQLEAAQRDIERLFRIVEALAIDVRERESLAAMQILREDLASRELAVQQREERIWAWRLIATARDGELQREVEELERRETAVRTREHALVQREVQVRAEEESLAQRAAFMEDEHKRNMQQVRQEVNRLRERMLGTSTGC